MKVKLGVMFGGETVEHEVSIISALQAIQNLNKDKYDVIPIYIGKNKVLYTGDSLLEIDTYKSFEDNRKDVKEVSLVKKDGKYFLQNTKGFIRKDITEVDIVLPVVHGNNVEDGTLAGFLDTIGIPYVGPHVLGAALGQDKVAMKQVMGSSGIPIVDYIWFFDNEYLDDKSNILKDVKKLGYPVVVKPATLGSSVGITFVKSEKDIEKAIDEAIGYDNKVVIEKAVDNLVEVNASVLGNYENQKVSPLEEVMGLDEILSYSDKYLSNSKTKGSGSKGMASTNRIIPARISKELTKEIQDTSKKVFKLLNLSGVCRIDYLIDKKTEKFYVNEPNTIPGSLSFYLWKEADVEYKDLLDEMISIAIKEYKNKSKKTMSFETNILAGFSGSKGTKGLKGSKN
jgi:D-alanine-D-alanine ligase